MDFMTVSTTKAFGKTNSHRKREKRKSNREKMIDGVLVYYLRNTWGFGALLNLA